MYVVYVCVCIYVCMYVCVWHVCIVQLKGRSLQSISYSNTPEFENKSNRTSPQKKEKYQTNKDLFWRQQIDLCVRFARARCTAVYPPARAALCVCVCCVCVCRVTFRTLPDDTSRDSVEIPKSMICTQAEPRVDARTKNTQKQRA